jgi:hypothetical protein
MISAMIDHFTILANLLDDGTGSGPVPMLRGIAGESGGN